MRLRFILIALLFLNLIGVWGQLPIADFEANNSDPCINETLSLTNLSLGGTKYEWDFCLGDLLDGDIVSNEIIVDGINNGDGYWFGKDNGQWFGFLVSSGNHSLFRLDFGTSPLGNPIITNLGNLEELAGKSPRGIDIIQKDGEWFGVVGYLSFGSTFTLLEFGNSLSNTPAASSLGDLGFFGRVLDLKIAEQGEQVFLVFPHYNNSRLYRINYGNSLTNEITSEDITFETITDSSLPRGIDLLNIEGNWKAIIVSESNSNIHQINLGSDLEATMTYEVTYNFPEIINPNRIKLTRDGTNFLAIVASTGSEMSIIDFHDLVTIHPAEISTPATFPRLQTIDAIKYNGAVIVQGTISNSTSLRTFHFENHCPATTVYSTQEGPDVSFSIDDSFRVELRAFNSNDSLSIHEDTIHVNSSISPSISFTTNNSCVSFEGAFDADTPDLSYSWDFGDGSIASGQNTSHQFASSGTYTVRLDVDDGTCSNFTEQEITIYEEPPVPDFEVVGNLCADGEITFNNLTDDALYEGPISYEWNFNDQSTATTRDASFVFGGPGMKTVTLTSSIPGCENFSQTVIDLEPGPTSLFSTSSVCQNDLMTFTNQSADATSYAWDFGDGFTSTEPNVSHVYTESGNFMVTLEAFDEAGCSAVYEQEVAISPEPATDFSYDIACKGNQGVEFIDQSTVEGADILSWEWRINDQLVSTEQSPTLSFDETGNVDVSLTVTSSNGCTKEYEETINVLEDPDPAFASEVSCQSLVSTFTDTSLNPEEIVSRVWEIEGQTYTTQEVNHTFSGLGQIDVNLTVTGQNFCSSTLYSTVTVPPAPVLDFSISSACSNEEIIFQDISTAADPIVSRSWTLDGTPFFNGSTAIIEELTPGNYSIGLTTLSESGCSFTLEQPLEIFDAPSASFTSSVSYGVPPFTLNLTNISAGADGQQWLVNGTEVATSANTSYTITSEGDYQVELVATNTEGCEDRSSLNVISRVPAINLVASNLTLTPNGNSQIISLQVTNNGNLPVEIFDVFVSSSKDFSFSERINQYLDIGGQSSIQLNSALQANSAQRICIRVQSAYDDIDPDNNEACINFTPKVVFEDMYPNPIDEEAVVRFILPEASKVRVFISNSTGKIITDQTSSFEKGLQVLRYNSSQWEKGLYFVTVQYNGEMTTRRVLKF